MKKNIRLIMLFLGAVWCFIQTGKASSPNYLYEEWRKSPYPSLGMAIEVNPSPLLWPSVKYWEKRDVLYNVYLSQDSLFSEKCTYRSLGQKYCFYNSHRQLEEGTWFWKYEVVENDKVIQYGPYNFIVRPQTEGLSTVDSKTFIQNIASAHPRVMNYGRDIKQIRKQALTHPLYKHILQKAKSIAHAEPYSGAVTDRNLAKARKLTQKANEEVDKFRSLLEGYTLTGDKEMLGALNKRLEILLGWPTDDLLGSRVLTALTLAFDMMYDDLSPEMKKQILNVADMQFKKGLSKWTGYTEARQVENHFWQMELAGNFTAALATLNHLASASDMLEYTYELFIARFPNLAGHDGGWAEGEGYYSVNQSAIVDMALLLHKIGGVDIFKMEWYKNLTDYFTYFSPVAAPVSGFGDMHDRVEAGGLKGRSEMLILGCEENNPNALYRLFSSLRPVESFFEHPEKKGEIQKELARIEPWYQIINDIRLTKKDAKRPSKLPFDKVFYGTGAAAMHVNVLEPAQNTTVFFRSSPFGSKGHMHANQNSFNLSRKGERLFYSTGYYTSFSDSHSLTSYRHTRAHNTILIDGCGQAFGHEGYGFIKRHVQGDKMSYVCGDASNAYSEVTDNQFLGFLKEHHIEQNEKFGMGNTNMKTFNRHLVFVRPDVVVIYDVLEANKPSEWTLLLHTIQPSVLNEGILHLQTLRSKADAYVFGSVPLNTSLSDQFFSPAIDFKKKYSKGTPLAFHSSYKSSVKTQGMRFLTVISLSDCNKEPFVVKQKGDNHWIVNGVDIYAEMNAEKPASLSVNYQGESLKVESDKTTLQGGKGKQCVADAIPKGNYVY